MNRSRYSLRLLFFLVFLCLEFRGAEGAEKLKVFRAGAAVVDITPTNFPVIVNAMFTERTATNAHDRLHARSLALDDGQERILITVVDSCMLPRDLIDSAKEMASARTGVPVDHMLVSATHTHSAPSAMGCLGSRPDLEYARFLPGKISMAIELAVGNLAPARVGWGSIDDYEHTHCRRWIRRPDRLLADPFGDVNVRAHMHPGYQSPDAIGPSGPVDPALSLLSVQTPAGKPIALLANYSMHYYESPLLSADYYGLFATKIGRLIGAEGGDGPFVGIMSQGTSGDQMWMDYGAPRKDIGLDAYAQEIAEVAARAYRQIQHHDWVPLQMREARLTLAFRVPDEQRLAWARDVAARLGDRLPRTMPEIYAKEAIYLNDRPTAELILQALRIGDLGIATIPNEVYAISGLKIKAQSPFGLTFNMELANGSEGYIPPPEQHRLGGYTTWPARTAGLETNAEPRIVETALHLLEEVSGQPRRVSAPRNGAYAQAILAIHPMGYWRLDEWNGPTAVDATGQHPALYEGNVAFYLEGPQSIAFSGQQINRTPHFAGGYLDARCALPAATYTVEFWFWNGLPSDARGVTGTLFSSGAGRDSLMIGGTNVTPGRLVFSSGTGTSLSGRTVLETRTWNHVAVVRHGAELAVYLNGVREISGNTSSRTGGAAESWTVGGGPGNPFNFEGKIDEVAAYDYTMSADEIARHVQLSGIRVAQAERPSAASAMSSGPKSPAESMAVLHVANGYEAELVAAEPLVSSPVALDWGTDGKLWVVEMADYPYGMDGKMKPGGRVRFLEDTDGDGKMDKSTVFLENVNFPNGIISWRKGVIVTAAPDIFYAEDTDGDGKADKREVLFTGFNQGNLQLRVNGLRWGLDNWVHCANGWSGGKPRSLKTGVEVDLSGRDLRIQPDLGGIEVESGQCEFGRNPDDWGNWFGCDNSYPLFHFVVEDRYMGRNPHVPAPDAKLQLYLPANPRVYPRSVEQKRYHSFEHASHFTSACSTDFYRDEWLFPRGLDEHVFTCEPVHNLVQHLLVRDEGVSFSARRAESDNESDFLASEDQWFRPVMARTGPDGALWVVDMYRYMIEHPDWLPPEGKKELEPFYRAGEDRGRIYRIVPKHPTGAPRKPLARLDRLGPEEWVTLLESPNGWLRDKAQQLLLWRNDPSVVPLLEKTGSHIENPLARVHALTTLDGLGALREEVLARALHDPAPAVRRHAVRLAESRVGDSPRLLGPLAQLTEDPDPKVRLQLACSLGECEGGAAGQALAQLALANAGDRYIRAAVMSSALRHVPELVDATLNSSGPGAEALAGPLVEMCVALNHRELIARLLAPILRVDLHAYTAGQLQTFAEYLDALARHRSSLSQTRAQSNDALALELAHVPDLFAEARRLGADDRAAMPVRLAAVNLLGRDETAADLPVLTPLLGPQVPGSLQRTALHSLARTGDAAVPGLVLRNWANGIPETRAAIVDELLGRENSALELLHRIEQGEIGLLEIGVAQRDRLVKHRSGSVRALAGRVVASASNPDRQRVVEQYRPALTLAGDVRRGRDAFVRVCATCHRLDGVGMEIGPNLESVRAHPPEKLLASILDPSREVEPRYLGYTCTLTGGDELYGLIASETGNGLEFKLTDGSTRAVLRSEIQSLQGSKLSLMPEGLETALSPQDIADVIEFLLHDPNQAVSH